MIFKIKESEIQNVHPFFLGLSLKIAKLEKLKLNKKIEEKIEKIIKKENCNFDIEDPSDYDYFFVVKRSFILR